MAEPRPTSMQAPLTAMSSIQPSTPIKRKPLNEHLNINGNGSPQAQKEWSSELSNGSTDPPTPKEHSASEYHHLFAVHSQVRTSCLSHDSAASPSFLGFRNLMVLVLSEFLVSFFNGELPPLSRVSPPWEGPIVMNLRLVIENFQKYGVLICVSCHDYSSSDLRLGLILYLLVPCHLFVAYIIEVVAASQAQGAIGRAKKQQDISSNHEQVKRRDSLEAARSIRSTWQWIAFAHAVNTTLSLLVTTVTVYWGINHPLIGTISELHALIVWLKIFSYAFTNRDLRYALLKEGPHENIPEMYKQCPYPRNISLANLSYFWWAPTLVYQPVYPRTDSIRWLFVLKRVSEVAVLSMFIWFASAQYAAPLLHNSLSKISSLDLASITERLMKLSTISLVIWLAGFFAIFQSALNALAEIMRFGDREFYTDWWNSPSVGTYWRTWNKPVNHFMRRHIQGPLVGRGWSPQVAMMWVFIFSGVLHELLVGIPTHNILGVAFIGMVVQIPLFFVTLPLEKMQGINGKIIGNCIFWVSFCLVGQPLAALMYFFAWQAKYGSVSKQRQQALQQPWIPMR